MLTNPCLALIMEVSTDESSILWSNGDIVLKTKAGYDGNGFQLR